MFSDSYVKINSLLLLCDFLSRTLPLQYPHRDIRRLSVSRKLAQVPSSATTFLPQRHSTVICIPKAGKPLQLLYCYRANS